MASRAEEWNLRDGDLTLELAKYLPGDPGLERAPAYRFTMVHTETGEAMGDIDLRNGNYTGIRLYSGHLGYEVYPAFRGKRYAERACRLLVPVARHLGIDPLWITCNPDNAASRRTCERLGAELVETVDIPPHINLYANGDRQKCRYRLETGARTS